LGIVAFDDLRFDRNGKYLDWAIPQNQLPDNFTWLVATLHSSTLTVLVKIAAVAPPIPSAASTPQNFPMQRTLRGRMWKIYHHTWAKKCRGYHGGIHGGILAFHGVSTDNRKIFSPGGRLRHGHGGPM
jgi:hypothetical protein